MPATTSVLDLYKQRLNERGYESDPAQLRAIEVLQNCANGWIEHKKQKVGILKKMFTRTEVPKGVYMYGGVGRGKSFLMDCFYDAVPIENKTRLHFHEFMREVHRELGKLQGTENPLEVLAKQMAQRFELICFDEFNIVNIADAMILHRLLEALFKNQVGFITTSNFEPDGLYPDGLHRDRILPAIELLKNQLHVINVDHGIDYRKRDTEKLPSYISPIQSDTTQKIKHAFDTLATTTTNTEPVSLGSRHIDVIARTNNIAWFDFRALCDKPLAQNDYLQLAMQFHTIFVTDIPQMSPNMASMARRFTLLIDVLYDRHVKLIASAEAQPENLYPKGDLAHEFVRTVSRLQEMQSIEYQELKHRHVDSSIT